MLQNLASSMLYSYFLLLNEYCEFCDILLYSQTVFRQLNVTLDHKISHMGIFFLFFIF